MKKLILSVFATAMVLAANAANSMYLSMENQTKATTNDFKEIAVSLVIDNDDPICSFEANVQLPAPLTWKNFVWDYIDEENGDFYPKYESEGRLNTKQNAVCEVITNSTNRFMFSVTSTAPQVASIGCLKNNSGKVYTFYFDGSTLENGKHEIRIASDWSHGIEESHLNFNSHMQTYADGSTKVVEEMISNSLFFEKTDGTIQVVAAPITAAVTIWKNNGTSEDIPNYDCSTPYVPTENSLLITEDVNVTGKNVILKAGETYTCDELEINDAYGFYSPVDFTADKVSYDRELDADRDYVSLCLPFAVPVGKINGAKVGYLYAFDGNDLTFKTQEGSTTPYKPYLVKTVAAGKLLQEINEPVIVKKTDDAVTEVEADNATHFGQMTKEVFVKNAENDYYAFVNNRFSRVATLTVSQFRTAIKLPATTDPINKLKSTDMSSLGIKFIDGDVPTGAEVVEAEAGNVNVFDALGRAVRLNVEADKATEGLKDGIYIVNGQKVIVKNK